MERKSEYGVENYVVCLGNVGWRFSGKGWSGEVSALFVQPLKRRAVVKYREVDRTTVRLPDIFPLNQADDDGSAQTQCEDACIYLWHIESGFVAKHAWKSSDVMSFIPFDSELWLTRTQVSSRNESVASLKISQDKWA